MKTVTDAGNAAGTPTTFVKNQLVIAVPKGNRVGAGDHQRDSIWRRQLRRWGGVPGAGCHDHTVL